MQVAFGENRSATEAANPQFRTDVLKENGESSSVSKRGSFGATLVQGPIDSKLGLDPAPEAPAGLALRQPSVAGSFWGQQPDGPEQRPLRVEPAFLPGLDPIWVPPEQRTVAIGSRSSLGFGFGANLNRVDGFSIMASQRFHNHGLVPDLGFYQGLGSKSRDWSGAAEVRFHPGHEALSLGARWMDETMPWWLPTQPLSAEENTIAAIFFRGDYSDYLRRRGHAWFAEWTPTPRSGIQVAFLRERHGAQDRRITRFGPFGGAATFRENPEIEAGRWDLLRTRLALRRAPDPSLWGEAANQALLVEAEWAGGNLGAGRTFLRLWAEHRGQVALTPSQGLGYRMAGGWTPEGSIDPDGSRLPVQWRFQAGGIGSLRGHDFQEFQGDRIALWTVEYGVDVGAVARPVLFLDGGKAWNESMKEEAGIGGSGQLALDGGVGLRLGARGPRFDLARDLRKERAAARLTVRLDLPY